MRSSKVVLSILLALVVGGRTSAPRDSSVLLDDLQKRTFLWFWETANPANGLIPDRWPSQSPSSIASVGFGLTAYPVAVEHGWITREQARQRVLTTLEFFAHRAAGDKGFFYHFLDMQTGERARQSELSTIDTTLFLAGALFCQSYFDQDQPDEIRIRNLAEELYEAVDWSYFLVRPPLVCMSWRPERGFSRSDWRGFDEASILYILALGSPTHPIDPSAWNTWTSTDKWESFYGQEFVNFAPLFGHQYSHAWIDFRGIQDDYFRGKGIDMFENSRRATLAQRAYAIDNPRRWKGYGKDVWGLTACDGPGGGAPFWRYHARGAAAGDTRDDGTIAPTASASSIAFAPDAVLQAIATMKNRYGDALYQQYGFVDAFNPTRNWFDADYLGIDQGPIVLMIENYRSGFVWNVMKKNPHIVRGLQRAGFHGGWLDRRIQSPVSSPADRPH